MSYGMDSYWYVLGSIGLLVLVSLLTRSGYFVFGDYLPLTESVRRALRYAPTAALTGIVVPELLPWQQGLAAFVDIRMLAAVVAVLVFVRTRNTILVIVGGMAAFWVFGAISRWL